MLFRTVRYQARASQKRPVMVHVNYHPGKSFVSLQFPLHPGSAKNCISQLLDTVSRTCLSAVPLEVSLMTTFEERKYQL